MAKGRGSEVKDKIRRRVICTRGAEATKVAFQRHPLAAERDAYLNSSYLRPYLDGLPQGSCAFRRLEVQPETPLWGEFVAVASP